MNAGLVQWTIFGALTSVNFQPHVLIVGKIYEGFDYLFIAPAGSFNTELGPYTDPLLRALIAIN